MEVEEDSLKAALKEAQKLAASNGKFIQLITGQTIYYVCDYFYLHSQKSSSDDEWRFRIEETEEVSYCDHPTITVFFLHGFFAYTETFTALIEQIKKDFFSKSVTLDDSIKEQCHLIKFVSYDRPGFGLSLPASDPGDEFDYRYYGSAVQFLLLAKHLNTTNFIMVGHSSGGLTCIQVAFLMRKIQESAVIKDFRLISESTREETDKPQEKAEVHEKQKDEENHMDWAEKNTEAETLKKFAKIDDVVHEKALVDLTASLSLKHIVLLNAALDDDDGPPPLALWFFNTSLGSSISKWGLRKVSYVPFSVKSMAMRKAYHQNAVVSPELAERYLGFDRLPNWDARIIKISQIYEPPKIKDKLDLIDTPVLWIHGTDDRIVHFEPSKQISTRLKNCTFVTAKDCGHMSHEECVHICVKEMLTVIFGVAKETADTKQS